MIAYMNNIHAKLQQNPLKTQPFINKKVIVKKYNISVLAIREKICVVPCGKIFQFIKRYSLKNLVEIGSYVGVAPSP